MRSKKCAKFLEIYTQRVKEYEELKEKAGSQAELDTLNIWIELTLENIRTIVDAMQKEVTK